jgi:molybdate transport system substrate-binding protein
MTDWPACIWQESMMRYAAVCKWMITALLATAAACASADQLLVSAASSLTHAFREVALGYQARHPGVEVALNFAASGVLLQQLDKGAPVDVLASADQHTMDLAQQRGLIGARRDFARNSLVVIVPVLRRDPDPLPSASLNRLADLARPEITRVAIGNPAIVPAGRYAGLALQAARLDLQGKTIQTQNVRQALDYVARGEVDAGFVYRTDAALMSGKVKVAFEVPQAEAILYPVAASRRSTNAFEAARFIDFLLSDAAQAILARHGFLKP